MGKTGKLLNERACRDAKPREADYALYDMFGLYLYIRTSGTKTWRLRYLQPTIRKVRRLTLGHYVSAAGGLTLDQARKKAQEARNLVEQGIDPQDLGPSQPNEPQAPQTELSETKFSLWWGKYRSHRLAGAGTDKKRIAYIEDCAGKIQTHVLPILGDIQIDKITSANVKTVLDALQAQGKFPTLKKVRGLIGQIIDYAGVSLNLPDTLNPAHSPRLNRQYHGNPVKHYAHLKNDQDIGRLMRGITAYRLKSPIVSLAFRFLVMTMVRPGNIAEAEWCEIDFGKEWWLIPGVKMKRVCNVELPHSVPLSRQALELLRELKIMTGYRPFLFPSVRSKSGCISDGTLLVALHNMGFPSSELVPHGCRGTATTMLAEHNWPENWVRKQLAHVNRNKVEAAYDHSANIDDRRIMLQWWSDYLDAMESEGKIPPKPSF